jgi:hypothetical protein
MTAKDVFSLLMRLGGVLTWTLMLFNLIRVAYALLHAPYPDRYGLAPDALGALAYLVVGVALFVGATPLAALAYGRRPNSN